tara:strand:+ start:56 stop:475 length:420 start_codon:yes stop_codon:yes gene_type:complete
MVSPYRGLSKTGFSLFFILVIINFNNIIKSNKEGVNVIKLIKALVATGVITQDTADKILVEFKGVSADDAVQDIMDAEPDEYLALAIIEMEDKSLAERRRIGKSKSIRARLQSTLCQQNKDGFNSRKWSQVAWALKNQR